MNLSSFKVILYPFWSPCMWPPLNIDLNGMYPPFFLIIDADSEISINAWFGPCGTVIAFEYSLFLNILCVFWIFSVFFRIFSVFLNILCLFSISFEYSLFLLNIRSRRRIFDYIYVLKSLFCLRFLLYTQIPRTIFFARLSLQIFSYKLLF